MQFPKFKNFILNWFKSERFLKVLTNWKFIIIFIVLVIATNTVFIFATIVEQEVNFPLTKIRRQGPFYARGIYLSAWTAGTPDLMDSYIDFIRRTELNAVVIDIKDSTGEVTYDSNLPIVNQLGTEKIKIKDLPALLDKLYQKGIYTIARIAVFQDSILAEKKPDLALKNKQTGKIWRDWKGLAWIDPAAKEAWAYNVALAREAFELGFDEVNFDYVRFPSDGDLNQIVYPFWDGRESMSEIIRQFFEYQYNHLKNFGPRSVDLFGLTLWHIEDDSDMNIGQKFVDATPYFDYICPMVYPSHYPPNFEGFKNPATQPYEIIYRSLIKGQKYLESLPPGIEIKSRIRPWLQAFNLGAEYTPRMIWQEKQAVYDAESFGWLFWNAQNKYWPIESALK